MGPGALVAEQATGGCLCPLPNPAHAPHRPWREHEVTRFLWLCLHHWLEWLCLRKRHCLPLRVHKPSSRVILDSSLFLSLPQTIYEWALSALPAVSVLIEPISLRLNPPSLSPLSPGSLWYRLLRLHPLLPKSSRRNHYKMRPYRTGIKTQM